MKQPKVKLQHEGVEPKIQYAALPWRRRKVLEILLITSRGTGRWIIPKGWPMKGRKPHTTAAIEAIQEAGLLGKIEKKPVGVFHYQKVLGNNERLLCRVEVFPLRVARQMKTWPEMHQRTTKWFSLREAIRLVSDPELVGVFEEFARRTSKPVKKAT